MFEFIDFSADRLQQLVLIISRASGLFILGPIFSDRSLPIQVKVAIALVLGVALMPVAEIEVLPAIPSTWELIGLVFHEIFVGILIGVVFIIIFWGAQTAGSLIGYQIGFAMVTMMDPSTRSRVSIIGQFWYLVAVVFFLAINGHHLVINALVDSYRVIPIGSMGIDASVGELLIKYTAYVFIVALKIASPVMVTLFLVDVALGTIAKMMPTMNVFFVGFPIKIGVGLVVMAFSLPVLTYVLEKAVHYLDGEMRTVLFAIGKV